VTGLQAGGCVALWNGAANADVRTRAAAMRPREVYVGIVTASGGIVAGPPPDRCAVFFRDPGGDGVPPSMLTITPSADGTSFALERAFRNEGAENTSLGGALEAVLADDGWMHLTGGGV
jgi:hypothetical protein